MKEKLNNVVEFVKENPVVTAIYAADAALIGVSCKVAVDYWRLFKRLDRRTEMLTRYKFGHDV